MTGTKRAARAALVVLAIAAIVPAHAAETGSWDLASAYLADSTANPIPSGDVEWHLLRSEGPSGVLTPLSTRLTNIGTVEGIVGFVGDESCNIHGCFPMVAVNTTGVDQKIPDSSVVVPAGAAFIHPASPGNGGNGNAAVAFRSPFTGWVSVTIELTRTDAGPISWLVDLNGQLLQGPETLGGGTGTFTAPQLKLFRGDLLTIRVDANGDYGCDSSTLSFRVERVPGP